MHHDNLFVASLTPSESCEYYVLFVHGGPGSHSAYFEAAIQDLDEYKKSNIGWVVYDQRGCGRSTKVQSQTHSENVDDLAALCQSLPRQLPKPLKAVFGHSYGARLAFDTFRKNSPSNLLLVMAGRSVYSIDSMNQSTLMDLYILRDYFPERFEEAFRLVAAHDGHASDKFGAIRALHDEKKRQECRADYYWGNRHARQWYQELKEKVNVDEDDSIFERVRKTYKEGDSVYFDPKMIAQRVLVVKGFWDFLMAGATTQGLSDNVMTFNGSGHYPHFEEPAKFLSAIREFIC